MRKPKCGTKGWFRPGENKCFAPGCGDHKSAHQVNERQESGGWSPPQKPKEPKVVYTKEYRMLQESRYY